MSVLEVSCDFEALTSNSRGPLKSSRFHRGEDWDVPLFGQLPASASFSVLLDACSVSSLSPSVVL